MLKHIIPDPDGKGLYCSDSLNHRIIYIDLNTKDVKTIVNDIKIPGNLAIDSSGKYLYYTESKMKSKIWRISLIEKRATPKLLYLNSFSNPKGLCFDGDDLIITEVEKSVAKFWNCSSRLNNICKRIITSEKILNVTSISCLNRESIIYYTTANPASIQRLILSTGKSKIVVKDLMAPNQISIKVTQTKCSLNNKCTDMCIKILNEEICSCSRDRYLLDDGKTCVGTVIWEEVSSSSCPKKCTNKNTTCSRIKGSQKTSCVCKPGYTSSETGNCTSKLIIPQLQTITTVAVIK